MLALWKEVFQAYQEPVFKLFQTTLGITFLFQSLPDILKGVQFLPSEKLPNGEALPSIPSGELPTLAISLPGKNDMRVHLYLGVNVFGAYLELDKFNNPRFGIIKRLTFPVKSRDGLKIVGYFSLIAPNQSFPANFAAYGTS